MSPENTVSSPLPDSTTGAIDFSKRAALRDIRDLGIGALGFRYFNSDFLKFKERQQATTNFTIPIVLGEPLATQELQKTVMIQDVNERELPDAKSTKMGMANTGETIDILDNDVADYGSNAHWDRVGVHERIETGPKAGEETGAVTIAHIIDATNGKPTAKTTTETIDLPLPTPKSIFQTSDLLRLNKPSVATGGSDNFNASVQTAFGIPSRTDRSSGKLKVVNPVDTDTANNPFISLTRAISVAAVQGRSLSTFDVGSLPIGAGQVSLPMSVYERSDKTKDVVVGRFGEYFIVSHLNTKVNATVTNVSDANIGILSWTAMVKRFGADEATRIASSVSQFSDRHSTFATNSRTGQVSLSTKNDSVTNQLLTELSSSPKASIYLPDQDIFVPQALSATTGNFISYIHDKKQNIITAVEKTSSGVEKVKNVWDLTKNAWVDVNSIVTPAQPATGEVGGETIEIDNTELPNNNDEIFVKLQEKKPAYRYSEKGVAMEEPYDFGEGFLTAARGQIIIPIGGKDGFSADRASLMQEVLDLMYAEPEIMKLFNDNQHFRFITNSPHRLAEAAGGNSQLAGPNYMLWFNIFGPEAKKTWGNVYGVQTVQPRMTELANGDANFLRGMEAALMAHEFGRIANANPNSATGLADDFAALAFETSIDSLLTTKYPSLQQGIDFVLKISTANAKPAQQ